MSYTCRAKIGDWVIVEWNDAVKHPEGEGKARHEPYVMRTAGRLLEKNRKGISIAGEECVTDDTWRDENFIPAAMIKRVIKWGSKI